MTISILDISKAKIKKIFCSVGKQGVFSDVYTLSQNAGNIQNVKGP